MSDARAPWKASSSTNHLAMTPASASPRLGPTRESRRLVRSDLLPPVARTRTKPIRAEDLARDRLPKGQVRGAAGDDAGEAGVAVRLRQVYSGNPDKSGNLDK